MNQHRIALVLFFLASFSSFASATSSLQESQQPIVTHADKFITQCHTQLSAIERVLRSLYVTITKERLYSRSRRRTIQSLITELTTLIQSLKEESFRDAGLDSCQLLVECNHRLIKLIDEQRKTRFSKADQFDLESLVQSLQTRKQLSPEDISKKFQETWHLILAIEKEGLGLSIKNKIMRWIDDKIVVPSRRYSIPLRVAEGAGTLFLGGYFWNKYNKEDSDSKNTCFNCNVKNPLFTRSNPPEKNVFFPAFFDRTDRVEDIWSHLIRHRAPIGEIGGGILAGYLLSEYGTYIKPFLEKKARIWFNKSKGGSYRKEADRIAEKKEKVYFKDVYGQDEIKRYLQFLVDYLEDSETYNRQGIRPPHGVLCIGDTRTGKTFCINAFLGEVDKMLRETGQEGKWTLFKPSVLQIKIEGMESILQRAKLKAPCVMFIDEIDLLDLQRTGENRTLSEFLTAMGEAVNSNDPKRQIFIFAATNCPETLDKALRQPGRFGKELRFEYPNYKDRYHFIRSKVMDFILPDQENEFDFEKLALLTNQQSYEKIGLFIMNAMMKAKIDNNGYLTQQHLESALEEDVFHIIPSHSKNIPENEQQILAAHFAGQALALALLESNMKLACVTIKQVMTELQEKVMGSHLWDAKNQEQKRFEYGKIFTYSEKDSINMQTHEEKMNMIKLHVAGFVAEELLLGSCSYSCHSETDHAIALNIAKSLVFQGIDESTLPKQRVKELYDQATALKSECMQQVRTLLENNKEMLTRIMNDLLKEQTLDAHDIHKRITAANKE